MTGEPDVVAEFYTRNKAEAPKAEAIRSVEQELGRKTGINPTGIAFENQLNLSISKEKLLLYRVSYNELYRVLKTDVYKRQKLPVFGTQKKNIPIRYVGNGF